MGAPGFRFSAPHLVRGREAPEPAALATTMNGRLLVAWIDSGDVVGGENSAPGVYAVTGSARDPGPPRLVARGQTGGGTPAVGIDGKRQGVVLWSGSAQNAEGTGGVYASVFGVP
jgi:hypothetical protein